jgi:site-specific DNA-cytosine methylase
VKTLRNLGYEIECCFFNSMFFAPCPQSRDRVYIVAWRKGNRRPDLDYMPVAYCASDRCGGRIVRAVQTWKRRTKAWPLARWGKYRRQYTYTCPECRAEVTPAAWPAFTSIDWSNLGVALGDRAGLGMKPLAPATVERIRRGMQKFRHYPPVIIPVKSVWGTDRPVTSPHTTQTTQQDKALVIAGVVPQRTDNVPASVFEQTNPVTTSGGGGHALASITLPVCGKTKDYHRARHASEPTFTQQTTPKLAVASMVIKNNGDESEAKYRAQHVSDPFGALTASPTQALASIILPAAGNTFEHGDYVRARHVLGQLWTQHTSQAFGIAAMPFMMNGQDNGSARSVAEAGFTARAIGQMLLVAPALFSKINGGPGDTVWHPTQDPFNTVTAHDTHGLIVLPWVEQFINNVDSVAVTEQLATVTTHMHHALASMEAEPGEPITEEDLMRTRFRMLSPDPELRRVMAFADDYILLGNQTQMTAGLGNAVTPPVAEWITEQCLATLRGGIEEGHAA